MLEKEAKLRSVWHAILRSSLHLPRGRSWGDIDDEKSFEVIIDNLMNLELLFWAAAKSGKKQPSAVSGQARTHARGVHGATAVSPAPRDPPSPTAVRRSSRSS